MDISIAHISPNAYEQYLDLLSSHSQASRQNRNADAMYTLHHVLFRQHPIAEPT